MTSHLRVTLAVCLLTAAVSIPAAFATNQLPRASSTPSESGTAKIATVRFTYVNPQLQPAKYFITVREDGSGHYRSERGPAPDSSRFPAQAENRDIQISAPAIHEIFQAARQTRYFGIHCENGGKRIAFQGTKTLEYHGPDGTGSCTYNWSNNKRIEKLTSIFEGISFTLIQGGKLRVEDAYFKLDLDPEMQMLVEAVQQGNALEIENIAPILEKINEDSRNLDRVRREARKLLDESGRRSESHDLGN